MEPPGPAAWNTEHNTRQTELCANQNARKTQFTKAKFWVKPTTCARGTACATLQRGMVDTTITKHDRWINHHPRTIHDRGAPPLCLDGSPSLGDVKAHDLACATVDHRHHTYPAVLFAPQTRRIDGPAEGVNGFETV